MPSPVASGVSVVKPAGTIAPAGSDQNFVARVASVAANGLAVTKEGNAVLAADVSTITANVYDLDSLTPSQIVNSPAISASNFVALVNDDFWPVDTFGRNFLLSVAGAVFSIPGHRYRVVVNLVLQSGAGAVWLHEHFAQRVIPT